MYMYAWEYEVDPAKLEQFLAAYGPDGDWVSLFRENAGYLRTELHRDRAAPNRFVTLDFWESAAAWETFRRDGAVEFERLDQRCEHYTINEREIGRFEIVGTNTARRH